MDLEIRQKRTSGGEHALHCTHSPFCHWQNFIIYRHSKSKCLTTFGSLWKSFPKLGFVTRFSSRFYAKFRTSSSFKHITTDATSHALPTGSLLLSSRSSGSTPGLCPGVLFTGNHPKTCGISLPRALCGCGSPRARSQATPTSNRATRFPSLGLGVLNRSGS